MVDKSGYQIHSFDEHGEEWVVRAQREDAAKAIAELFRNMGHSKVVIRTDRRDA